MTTQDFDTNHSMNPDLEDLQQEEADAYAVAPVAVRVAGGVRVHQLPPRVANSRSLTVTDSADQTALEIIASEDPRRQYLVVSCQTQPVYLGHSKQDVAAGVAGILPTGVLLHLPTSAPVYVRCATVGQTAVVSYWTGEWAD